MEKIGTDGQRRGCRRCICGQQQARGARQHRQTCRPGRRRLAGRSAIGFSQSLHRQKSPRSGVTNGAGVLRGFADLPAEGFLCVVAPVRQAQRPRDRNK
ncbi:MAG: hypothetical protein E5Y69_23495 [Mesorhizobium sp.]|nr:MAG: hypothetical protein E5Y69_23495 [Mesorhizobium sp.]